MSTSYGAEYFNHFDLYWGFEGSPNLGQKNNKTVEMVKSSSHFACEIMMGKMTDFCNSLPIVRQNGENGNSENGKLTERSKQ